MKFKYELLNQSMKESLLNTKQLELRLEKVGIGIWDLSAKQLERSKIAIENTHLILTIDPEG